MGFISSPQSGSAVSKRSPWDLGEENTGGSDCPAALESQKWAQLDGNKPDVLSRKKPSVLHLREMVTALKIQGAMGKGWGWEDSHVLGLLFMTQRVRTGTRGWKPGYGFELGIRICFLTEPSSRSWDGGLRRNRVLFLERFKQSRWPPTSLLILCLYGFAGSCPSPQSCCRHMSSVLGW